jgi:hypothetical protein
MMAIFLLPAWLTGESNLTLATWGLVSATLVLGVATFLLYLDGRSKSREQRHRWEREDALRESETQPKADFGLEISKEGILELWCANLGISSFLISSIQMTAVSPSDSNVVALNSVIVPLGQVAKVELLRIPGIGRFGMVGGNREISLELQGPVSRITTSAKQYSVSIWSNLIFLKPYFAEFEPITCTECGNQIAAAYKFDKASLINLEECREEISKITGDFAKTCPNHASGSAGII